MLSENKTLNKLSEIVTKIKGKCGSNCYGLRISDYRLHCNVGIILIHKLHNNY